MKLFKSLLATTVLAAVSAPAFAADADLYGKLNVTFQSSDSGDGAVTELKSNASRVGIKGSEKLEGGLTLVYKYEFQVDVTDESKEKNLKSRNQYIGVKGSFGEVLLGRNDTVLKQSQGKADIFSDQNADIKSLWEGENRTSDTVTYKSPKFNGIQIGVSYVLDEENDEAGTSLSATYGDKGLKKSDYYAAIAVDSEIDGHDITRLTVGAKVAGFKLGAMYQTEEPVDGGDSASGMLLSAIYPYAGYDLKAQFQTLEDDSGFTIGADRKLGKNTKAFAFYTTFTPDVGEDSSYLGLGLEQKF